MVAFKLKNFFYSRFLVHHFVESKIRLVVGKLFIGDASDNGKQMYMQVSLKKTTRTFSWAGF